MSSLGLDVTLDLGQPLLNPPLFEKFLIHGLLLLKNTVKNSAYTTEKSTTPEETAKVTQARYIIDNGLLTSAFVNSFAEVLISRYMTLRTQDLEQWQEDPEQWINNEETDQWEFDLRRCAERVFMELVSQNRQQLSPVLMSLAESVASMRSMFDFLSQFRFND